MKKSRLVEYSFDEETEVATLTYDDGRVHTRYQPLPVVKKSELRDSYFANLLVWLRLDNGF